MSSKYMERKNFIINVLFFGVIAVLLYLAIKYALSWLLPFLIGFAVALLLKRVIRFVSEKIRLPYKAAALILVLLFYAVVCALLALLLTEIIYVIQSSFSGLPGIFEQFIEPLIRNALDRLNTMSSRFEPGIAQLIGSMTSSLYNSLGSMVTGLSAEVIKGLSAVILSVPGLLLAMLLSVISTILFAMDFNLISGFLVRKLPGRSQSTVLLLKNIASGLLMKYVKSYAILTAVTFTELSIGFLIIGVDSALAVALILAFVDLVPLIGCGGVLIPWIIIKLVQGNMPFAIGLTVLYVVIYIVRNILEPRIVGHEIGIHPLAMLISMYVGLQIFGFIGIFVLPIMVVVAKGLYDERNANRPENMAAGSGSAGKRRPGRSEPLEKPAGENKN